MQRQPVGQSRPVEKSNVTTSWDNRKYTVQAAADSTWKTAVATPAAGGPYSIRISDGEAIVLDNVMIGEVWICSGQSNMQMPVTGFPGQPVVGSNEAILNGTNSDIRMFVVRREVSDRPLDDCNTDTGWQEATTESVAGFTAVGYFFGLNLYKVLGIPIGLIETDWGGTRIETWMDMETAQKVEQNQVEKDKNHQAPNKTAQLYNAMIHPLVNYTAQGFIWYQGESNIHTGNAHLYSQYMQQLVSLWRNEWGNQQMPFYYVQIAPFVYEGDDKTSVPLIVEQQLAAMDKIPYSGMASTTDIGSGPCIHPSQKIPVGERLALLALSKTYGKKGLICESPRFESVRFEDGQGDRAFQDRRYAGPGLFGTDQRLRDRRSRQDFRSGTGRIHRRTTGDRRQARQIVENPSPCATRSATYPTRRHCTIPEDCPRSRSARTTGTMRSKTAVPRSRQA